MRLTILGNGFDIAHNLPTKLTDFRTFLRENYDYEEINDFEPTFTAPQETTVSGGDVGVPQEEVARFMDYLITTSNAEDDADNAEDILWSNLENTLGKLNPQVFLNTASEEYDEYGEYDYRNNIFNIQDIASGFSPALLEFSKLFNKWIGTIQIGNAESNAGLSKLLEKFDPCLSFNYTLTTEELYKVENITHIHGMYGDRKLILGHAPCERIETNYSIHEDAAGDMLDDFHDRLEKDTERIIRLHSNFFCEDNLSRISEVYTYGFSYSAADIPYIKEIISLIPSNTNWFINDFGEFDKYEQILVSLGFSGEIHSYTFET